MKTPLMPLPPSTFRFTRVGVVALLALSATCVFLAPWMMPDDYSWLSNVISESAAQGVEGAWVARLGFLLFGSAVLWLALSLRSSWARGAYWMHIAFGVFMISTAAFSHRPWQNDVPFDAFEDFLHSVTATAMGFAFSFGVLARTFQRKSDEALKRSLDVLAIIAAIFLPLLGGLEPAYAGLAQRSMFAIAYLWYGSEAPAARQPARNTRARRRSPARKARRRQGVVG